MGSPKSTRLRGNSQSKDLQELLFAQAGKHCSQEVRASLLQSKRRQTPLSSTIFRSLLKLISIELVMPSNHLILCRPLLLLPSIFLSIRVFSNELSLCIRWPKSWSFSFSINTSNEYSGLISFRIDCFDLGVQGTLTGD